MTALSPGTSDLDEVNNGLCKTSRKPEEVEEDKFGSLLHKGSSMKGYRVIAICKIKGERGTAKEADDEDDVDEVEYVD